MIASEMVDLEAICEDGMMSWRSTKTKSKSLCFYTWVGRCWTEQMRFWAERRDDTGGANTRGKTSYKMSSRYIFPNFLHTPHARPGEQDAIVSSLDYGQRYEIWASRERKMQHSDRRVENSSVSMTEVGEFPWVNDRNRTKQQLHVFQLTYSKTWFWIQSDDRSGCSPSVMHTRPDMQL